MKDTLDTLQTATKQPARASKPAGRKPTGAPTKMICDLAEASAFVEEYRKPHVPVMSAFGGGRLHTCRLYGSWDLDRMAKDHADVLFRSIRKLPAKNTKEPKKVWDDLTFRFGPQAFVYADINRIAPAGI